MSTDGPPATMLRATDLFLPVEASSHVVATSSRVATLHVVATRSRSTESSLPVAASTPAIATPEAASTSQGFQEAMKILK